MPRAFSRQHACILLTLLFLGMGDAAAAAPAETAVPRAAHKYRAALVSAARQEFGLNAPVALLAAQIHQESRWRENAVSPAGAKGLAQFMPATARWLPEVAPHTGEPAPFNPGWSLRAMCAYDKYLYSRIRNAAGECDRWAFTLCAYNGGLGWVNRDRALAQRKGLDPAVYWKQVETVNAGRRASAFRENRGYPERIFRIQRAYADDGWGPGVACE